MLLSARQYTCNDTELPTTSCISPSTCHIILKISVFNLSCLLVGKFLHTKNSLWIYSKCLEYLACNRCSSICEIKNYLCNSFILSHVFTTNYVVIIHLYMFSLLNSLPLAQTLSYLQNLTICLAQSRFSISFYETELVFFGRWLHHVETNNKPGGMLNFHFIHDPITIETKRMYFFYLTASKQTTSKVIDLKRWLFYFILLSSEILYVN